MIHSALLQLAARQFGVVSRSQLDDLGCSNAQLSRARRQRLVVDVTTQTIRLCSSPDTFLARATAVSLHLGERGFLSGATAGRLYNLREMASDPICATVPAGDRPNLPAWVALRSTTSYDARRHRRRLAGGAIVAEPHRMLYDLAARLDDDRFQRAAEDCWHLRLISPASAAMYLRHHRRQGKDGTLRMERWLEAALEQDRPAESGLELDLIAALRAVGLPDPVRQHQLQLASGQRIRVDLAWPGLRLCVEPGHSWWHGGDDAMRRDNARVLGALAIGWETIQLDESLRCDPRQAAEMVQRAYRHRAALFHDPPSVGNEREGIS
ncbi:hypothetical protein [Ilumatobacter sp.]|uniref:hypothetical protein n=1 Tax=Ilumatobacter sp. TaxID=1967498 RepID=UPI003C58372C